MTKNCIKQVDDLQQESEVFCDLSVEQLLYAAIKGTSIEEVGYIFNEFMEAEEESI